MRESSWRVVHVAEDMAAVAGGVPAVVHQLSTRLADVGVRSQIVHALGQPGPLPETVETVAYPPQGVRRAWSWGHGLEAGLRNLALADSAMSAVFHLHGIWSAPHYFAAKVAYQAEVPFIVTAHGMLEPWLWDQQGWKIRLKKQLYWRMFAYPALSRASVVHAITPMERDHLRRLFPENRIEVIPNAIDVDKTESQAVVGDVERERIILFLGRVEPKKGVDILLKAFANARIEREWRVVVIGPVWSDEYMQELKRVVRENDLEQRVEFLGPTFGDEKIRWLKRAWVMAVPSHSEVVGLVNLEAAVHRLPTIASHQTGLFDWEEGGGLLIQPDVLDMRRALERACSWSDTEQVERGERSRNLVLSKYSWTAVLPQWLSLYESMIGGRE